MQKVSQAFLFALIGATLTACFESKQPLIGEGDSVTPVRPGTYVSSSSLEQGREFKVAVAGAVTYVTEIDAHGKADVSTYLARPLRDGYFIVMDRSNFRYGLIGVDHQQVTSYTSTNSANHCERLEELAFSKDVPLSSYGVSDLHDGTCYFDKFDKLAGAFRALLDANKLEVVATYRPKELKSSQNTGAPKVDNGSQALNDLTAVQKLLSARGFAIENILEFIRDEHDQAIRRVSPGEPTRN
jgi:hypothetical protein